MIHPFKRIFSLLNIRHRAGYGFCKLFAVNVGIHADGIAVTVFDGLPDC